jgi:hypothetical protein
MPPKNRRSRGKRRSKNSSVDSQIVQFARASGSDTTIVPEDMHQRTQNFNIVQRPPKNWLTQTYWTKLMYDFNFTNSTSIVTETNVYFPLSNFQDYSSFTSCFDQYCIYAITVTISLLSSATSYTTPIGVYTAIDYDNTASIGKAGIMGLSTCNFSQVSMSNTTSRFFRPCIAPVIYNTASAFNGTGVSRSWLDVASVNVPHYGWRSVVNPSASQQPLEVNVTAMVGWRNTI